MDRGDDSGHSSHCISELRDYIERTVMSKGGDGMICRMFCLCCLQLCWLAWELRSVCVCVILLAILWLNSLAAKEFGVCVRDLLAGFSVLVAGCVVLCCALHLMSSHAYHGSSVACKPHRPKINE